MTLRMRINYLENPVSNKNKGLTTSAVLLIMFAQGLALAYPFSLLPEVNHPKSRIKANIHISSWLGSIIGTSNIVGFLIGSVLMKHCGRKLASVTTIFLGIAGWLTIYFAKDIKMLIIGRFLSAVSPGSSLHIETVIVGEYAAAKYRGVFINVKNTALCIGAMSMHIMSRFFHWRTIAIISVAPLVIALVLVCIWTRNSARLTSRYQNEICEHGFTSIEDNIGEARQVQGETIKSLTAKLSVKNMLLRPLKIVIDFCRKFKRKDFRKPFTIMILSSIVLEMSGKTMFLCYAWQIITEMTGDVIEPFHYSLCIDTAIIASSVVAIVFGNIFDRRTLLFYSGVSALSIFISLWIHMLLASNDTLPIVQTWIPLGLFGLYFVFVTAGCAFLPIVIVTEIFPSQHKEVGLALSEVWMTICQIMSLKAAPHLIVNLEVHGFLMSYGSIMGFCLTILYFILPETKDRTAQEMEFYFNHEKFANGLRVVDKVAITEKTKEKANIV